MRDKALKLRVAALNHMVSKGYEIDKQGRLVHRVVCRQAHGPFPSDWVVHHVDENNKNNVPDNLIALPRRLHSKMHTTMKKLKVCFDRPAIEQMLRCYLRGQRNRDVNIVINVQVLDGKLTAR